MGAKKSVRIDRSRVGGFFFYLSLSFLGLVALINYSLLIRITKEIGDLSAIAAFIISGCLGAFFSHRFIQGKLHVFLHEFKHALLSHFAGNKEKEMVVKSETGHFQYSYTKQSAKFNAFISLAPYFLPLFTMAALVLALPFFREQHALFVLCAGLGYGMDLALNIRDISPIQTDISEIRGGYNVGLSYIIAMNACILSFLLTWVVADIEGLRHLSGGWWLLAEALAKGISG